MMVINGQKIIEKSHPELGAIWNNSSDYLFAVGDNGAFFHYNGIDWIEISANTSIQFKSIWGYSANDVFAAAESYDDMGNRYDAIYHYDGNAWSEMMKASIGNSITGIWGNNSTDVFAVGNNGKIYHYNGVNWNEMTIDTPSHFGSIWGNSSNDIFVAGNYYNYITGGMHGTIHHYDGYNWNEMLDMPSVYINDIWSYSHSDVFAVGYHYNEGTRQTWMILYYNGSNWQEMTVPISDKKFLNCVWGTSNNNVYVGSLGALLHYDGSNWSIIPLEDGSSINDIWGSSENNIYAVGSMGFSYNMHHFDGKNWTFMEDSPFATVLEGVWGSSPSDVFIVGDNGVFHYSPPDESPLLSVTPLNASIPSASGTTTFTVLNSGTGTLTWTAAETESWLSISPSSGTNTGTITVNYNANSGDTRTGTITITAPGAANSPKTITITQAAKQAHFTPVWTGNSYNRMNFWIVGAAIDGIPLSAGDEIAIFDGTKCVGSAIVSKEISYDNLLTIAASQDDGSGNGFSKGNAITFKFWDADKGTEKTGVIPYFKDITTGNPITAPAFDPNGDYGVNLEIGGDSQSIALNTGWNIMSSFMVPETTDMLALLQPIINAGCLEKVISESGGRVIKIFGNWKNTIGDYNPDEGYKIKLTCDTDFSLKGFSMQSQSNMYAASQQMSLTAGWNIISYPYAVSQNAMTAVQPLIDSGSLVKVIDETGATIINVFGSWKNNIGEFKPGEGYEIKVSEDIYLSLKEPETAAGTAARSDYYPTARTGSHFIPVWTGNPYNPMNMWAVGVNEIIPESGDEIGVFDNGICVGAGLITNEISQQNPLQIILSQDDNDGKGFIEANVITIKYWDADTRKEFTVTPDFTDTDGNPIDTPVFTGKADYGVSLTLNEYQLFLTDALTGLKILAGMSVSPANSDADKDGKVEIQDVIYILQIISEMRK